MNQAVLEQEARRMYGRPYDECTDEQQALCEDFAYEYCGISRDECEECAALGWKA